MRVPSGTSLIRANQVYTEPPHIFLLLLTDQTLKLKETFYGGAHSPTNNPGTMWSVSNLLPLGPSPVGIPSQMAPVPSIIRATVPSPATCLGSDAPRLNEALEETSWPHIRARSTSILPGASASVAAVLSSREEGQHSWAAGVLFKGKVSVQRRSPALPEPRDTDVGVFLTLHAPCQALTRLMPWEDSVLQWGMHLSS